MSKYLLTIVNKDTQVKIASNKMRNSAPTIRYQLCYSLVTVMSLPLILLSFCL